MSYGVLYAATGERYIREALQSAQSLNLAMPDCPIAFVVDEPHLVHTSDVSVDQILLLDDPKYRYEDKITGMMLSPYKRTLFLDSDTYVAKPFPELFQLLDRFDIAAKHDSRRSSAFLERVPDSFPEYNSGVVLFRESKRIDAFFRLWLDTCRIQSDESWPHHYRETRNDQPSFRDALYVSDLRIATLGEEYNAQMSLGLLGDYVKIIHGRGGSRVLQQVADIINFDPGRRVYYIHERRKKRIRARAGKWIFLVGTETRKPNPLSQLRISVNKRGITRTFTHSFSWIVRRLRLKVGL